MRKIFRYFTDFHKSYFNIRLYLVSLLFISGLIAFNYIYDFEDAYLDKLPEAYRFIGFTLYHAFAWFGILLIVFLLGSSKLRLDKWFWIKSILGFLILGLDRSFYSYYKVFYSHLPPETLKFYYRLATNSTGLLVILLPLTMVKYFFDWRDGNGIYGLKFKKVDWKPYWLMLLIMVPLVYLASLTPDFIDYYPTYKRARGAEFAAYYQFSEYWSRLIYEVFYIADFTFTELFFRGFLVIGFARLLGKDSIIPMAACYAVLHFGKPIGETISSVFGGYILGIVALYSRNIWGGIFVHGGIAFLMEVFAFLQMTKH